jgi:hypothetical protein
MEKQEKLVIDASMIGSISSMSFRTAAILRAAVIASAVILAAGCSGSRTATGQAGPSSASAPGSVAKFGLMEVSLRDSTAYENPFLDVVVDAEFSAPDGSRVRVPGFYYGGGVWKIRMRPHVDGRWAYRWEFGAARTRKHGTGAFLCTLPGEGQGRIRLSAANPHQWIFENGEPFFPIGLQEGVTADGPADYEIDGAGRNDRPRIVSARQYFEIYGRAGFNLFRFSQRNQTYTLFDDLDHYREHESQTTDRLMELLRRQGFRVVFGFFGYYGQWAEGDTRWERTLNRLRRLEYLLPSEAINRPRDLETIQREQRFIRYVIARWGAYADFWELLNERRASDEWINTMAAYVHSIDPDRKPVGTSWESPALQEIDVNTPHWYESENEFESDLRVRQKAVAWKAFGKPVLVGEQGNTGMNWDITSALRMRVRSWTALFQQIGLIFWNTSWSKAGMNQGRRIPENASNIYLGPEERDYIRTLARFAARLPADMTPTAISVAGGEVRAHALCSRTMAAAYLHHYANHTSRIRGVSIGLALPEGSSFRAEWIDPANGEVLAVLPVRAGTKTLAVPPFRVDAALLLSPEPGT